MEDPMDTPRPTPGLAVARRRASDAPSRASHRLAAVALAVAAALVALATPAAAQRVTGGVDGTVLKSGAPQAAATVVATDLTTGNVITVKSSASGAYSLSGLAPGAYLLTITLASGEEATEYVQVGIGQTLRLDVDVGSATVRGGETIEVSGRLADTTTSEVATDVDRDQIENLPQNSRNFLNFAQLAPGVRLSQDELARNVSSAGQAARQTNVFVDGVSLKNNIIEGGVVGQDASRGNPFPQLAIGGFRVLTQNFKAEYEQAGSSIISTITRSGGNEPHVELYGSFQDRNITSIDPFVEKLMEPKPRYKRYQVGGLISGPILKDKLYALATYEGNYQDRQSIVSIGNPTPENLAQFGQHQGAFTSPFREHLGFAKVTWLPAPAQTVDVSAFIRRETDIRSFGGPNAYEFAENVRNNQLTVSARHQWRLPSDLINEATFQFLNSQFNPTAEFPDLVGQDYQGVIRLGGRDTSQDIVQRTFTLRDDVTLPGFEAAGDHRIKVGAKVAFQHYQVERAQFGNPVFRYRIDPANNLDYDIPFEAQYGVGDPRVTSSNTQIGVFAQDDWQLNRQLELNLGVRWDVETNPLNNDYETPADVRAAVTELAMTVAELNGPDFFEVDNYLTDGSQRSIFLGAIQPRIGASYDLFADQRTVLFAGAGRYYDRTLFNTGVDERLRLQYGVRTFRFSRDGLPRDGQETIVWDPAYLSRDGLQQLIDQGIAPNPEIFLLENDTKPLHSDQFSGGVRQRIAMFDLSATFSHIRSKNGVGFYPANRAATGNRDFLPVPGNFGNVIISADDVESKYTAIYLTAEKSYDEQSKWGVSATYTLSWSKIRGDTFNFDFPTIKDTPWTPGDQDERHRLVIGGIVGLPQDFRASTFIQLGTGVPFNISDASAGFGENFRFRRNAGRDDKFLEYKQVDLRLTKELKLTDKSHASFFVECFNVFNWYNYGGYDGFIPPSDGDPNPNFGKPTRLVGPTRSFQVGLTYGF
jgi:hypothetical protein